MGRVRIRYEISISAVRIQVALVEQVRQEFWDSFFQVLVSNGLCGRDICVEAITVLYESHVVQIRRDNQTHEVRGSGPKLFKE